MKLALTLGVALVAVLVAAAVGWRQAAELRDQNQRLADQMETVKNASENSIQKVKTDQQKKISALQKTADEVYKLRGDVGRLKGGEGELAKLAAANQRLKAENIQLRLNAVGAAAEAMQPEEVANPYSKENWDFAGFDSPENALVSAIWAMQQGDPNAYFDSLAPAEQERMNEVWQDKTEEEVAGKHQSDVEAISGLKMLNREDISESETIMNVYIEGPDRLAKVRMEMVEGQWKFGGYVPDGE